MFIIINSETLTAKDIETLKSLFMGTAAPTEPTVLVDETPMPEPAEPEPVNPAPEPAEKKPKRKYAKYPYKRPAGWEPDAEFYSVLEQWKSGAYTSAEAAKEANMTKNQFDWWRRKLGCRRRENPYPRSMQVNEVVASPEFKAIAVAWSAGVYTKDEAVAKSGLPASTFYKRAKLFLREIAAA